MGRPLDNFNHYNSKKMGDPRALAKILMKQKEDIEAEMVCSLNANEQGCELTNSLSRTSICLNSSL